MGRNADLLFLDFVSWIHSQALLPESPEEVIDAHTGEPINYSPWWGTELVLAPKGPGIVHNLEPTALLWFGKVSTPEDAVLSFSTSTQGGQMNIEIKKRS